MQAFRTYINSMISTPVSDPDFARISAAFVRKRLKKKEFLLRAGEVCKYLAFVLTGALRLYSVDAKGDEYVLHFGVENGWVGDRESYAGLMPSRYYIDALEDADLLLITRAQLKTLIQTVPAMAELMQGQDRQQVIASQKRLYTAISYPAEERYAAFVAEHPDYLRRFPHHIIASYLGILPETLSRIRTRLLHAKAQPAEVFS